MLSAVDLFAGAGGFTEAARLSGIKVVWAANHWPLAVEVHAANHPHTLHACQDLEQADWSAVPRHDIQMASPACQGHSRARGKERPHHERLRSTAWAVVNCAEYHRSPLVLVENVPDFLGWQLYPSWEDAMKRLGYCVSPLLVDAADHGVPQHRVRIFLVCTRSKKPLKLKLPQRPHRPVADVIEWNQHSWSPVNKTGRCERTLAKIAAGRARYGKRFVIPYYSSGSGLTGRSIERPLGTVTTIDRWAVVDGDRMRMLQLPELRAAMGFRKDYILPSEHRAAVKMLGNAVPPQPASDILDELKRAA